MRPREQFTRREGPPRENEKCALHASLDATDPLHGGQQPLAAARLRLLAPPADASRHLIGNAADSAAIIPAVAQRTADASRMRPREQFTRREGPPRENEKCALHASLDATDPLHGGQQPLAAARLRLLAPHLRSHSRCSHRSCPAKLTRFGAGSSVPH
jgi:hypothetical protein